MYIIDRYTYYALEFLERVQPNSQRTMGEFMEVCPKRVCISTVGRRTDLFGRDPYKVRITDFFGSVRPVDLSNNPVNMSAPEPEQKTTENYEKTEKFHFEDLFPVDLLVNQKWFILTNTNITIDHNWSIQQICVFVYLGIFILRRIHFMFSSFIILCYSFFSFIIIVSVSFHKSYVYCLVSFLKFTVF